MVKLGSGAYNAYKVSTVKRDGEVIVLLRRVRGLRSCRVVVLVEPRY